MLSKLRHIAAHRSTVHCGRLPVRCHHIVSIDNCTSSNTAFPTGGCERERECEGVRRSVRTGMRDQQQSSFVGMHSRSRHLAKRSRPTSVMRPSCTDIRTLIAPHEAHPAAQSFVWRKVGRFQTRVQLLNPVIFIFILFCCFFFFLALSRAGKFPHAGRLSTHSRTRPCQTDLTAPHQSIPLVAVVAVTGAHLEHRLLPTPM